MRKVWVLLLGLFGFANVLLGWFGAWIGLGGPLFPADWLGYLCLGIAVVLSLLGRKRKEEG